MDEQEHSYSRTAIWAFVFSPILSGVYAIILLHPSNILGAEGLQGMGHLMLLIILAGIGITFGILSLASIKKTKQRGKIFAVSSIMFGFFLPFMIIFAGF